MTIKGLHNLDVPQFLLEPHSCKRCVHSFYTSDDVVMRYMRCGRSEYQQQCRYERHETGDCKADAIYFKERVE